MDISGIPTYTILGTYWFSNKLGLIVIVAVQTSENEWKAYIGNPTGLMEGDEQLVAAYGSSLDSEQAHGFFPQLPIEQYKKW